MTTFFALAVAASIELVLLYLVSSRLSRLLYRRLGQILYLLFVWPGVMVHELSHLLACLVTRTRVREVHLFEPRQGQDGTLVLGFVRHDVAGNPFAAAFIGAAPFFGASGVLWAILRLFYPTVLVGGTGNWTDAAFWLDPVARLAAQVWQMGWLSLLVVWLVVAVSSHAAPSRTDLRHTVAGLLTIAVLGALAAVAGRWLPPIQMGRVGEWFVRVFIIVDTMLAWGLAVSVIAGAVTWLLSALVDGLFALFRRR